MTYETPLAVARRLKREQEAVKCAGLLAGMPEGERAFRCAVWAARGFEGQPDSDELTRRIIITPFDGAYGRAGCVVAIEGTPPKGCYAVLCDGQLDSALVYDLCTTKARAPLAPWGPRSGQELRQTILGLLRERGLA